MTTEIEINEPLNDHEIIGLVVPGLLYEEMLLKVARDLSKSYNKILYISVNKPYDELSRKFKENKINLNNFYFIDCVTRTTLKDTVPKKNCTYVSSPKALDEIQTTILYVLHEQSVDVALIDSPSSLMEYYEYPDVLRFIHLLMTKILISGCKGIFPFQKESADHLRKSIEMFTDEIVSFDKFDK